MFFRLWFYLCKLAILCFVMLFAIPLLLEDPKWLWLWVGALLVIVVLGCTGAILAIAVFLFGMRLRCPLCGRPGQLAGNRYILALLCDDCGAVTGNVFKDFRLHREPWPSEPEQGESSGADESDES